MKPWRMFSLILSCVAALYFIIFSFSGISIAEQKSVKDCISNCTKKQQVCLNINADKRMCNVEFQNCVDACNTASEPSSSEQPSTPQGSDRNLKPM
jgi:hypothetical protein